ncbi:MULTISPECIES: hypothetical protein [Clostridium]|uniref:Uncharacterized protein n=1 Tax=Clostridium senegalense TaxID=1465809 RepID=A0A6M0H5F3_9CLOT|nr:MULTISPECIES: hypothetical protein [Clostridium]NEU04812.1 hypothetical protein [Clostridium senegalense]
MTLGILYLVLIFIFFYYGKKNYLQKAKRINKNLEEFNLDILKTYNSLNLNNQSRLLNGLTDIESYYFNSIMDNSFPYSQNINKVQTYMFHLEEIMKKLKILKRKQIKEDSLNNKLSY